MAAVSECVFSVENTGQWEKSRNQVIFIGIYHCRNFWKWIFLWGQTIK